MRLFFYLCQITHFRFPHYIATFFPSPIVIKLFCTLCNVYCTDTQIPSYFSLIPQSLACWSLSLIFLRWYNSNVHTSPSVQYFRYYTVIVEFCCTCVCDAIAILPDLGAVVRNWIQQLLSNCDRNFDWVLCVCLRVLTYVALTGL